MMKAAAPKTYISSRMMEQYRQRRAAKEEEKTLASQPKVTKKFAEDEEEKKEEVQPQAQAQAPQKNMMMLASENVEVVQEKDVVEAEKPGFFKRLASSVFGSKSKEQESVVARRASFEYDVDRNLSCEEMDSDDLGGDLNLSDQEDGMDCRAFRREFKASKRAVTKQKA